MLNSKVLALAVIAIFVFGTVYAGVGIEEADAAKSKKNHKINSVKAQKGLQARNMLKHR